MVSLATFREKLVMSVEGEVRFDRGTIAVYSYDASNYRQVPIGVVMPRHEEDVIAAVSLARENNIPILARGGGTAELCSGLDIFSVGPLGLDEEILAPSSGG